MNAHKRVSARGRLRMSARKRVSARERVRVSTRNLLSARERARVSARAQRPVSPRWPRNLVPGPGMVACSASGQDRRESLRSKRAPRSVSQRWPGNIVPGLTHSDRAFKLSSFQAFKLSSLEAFKLTLPSGSPGGILADPTSSAVRLTSLLTAGNGTGKPNFQAFKLSSL